MSGSASEYPYSKPTMLNSEIGLSWTQNWAWRGRPSGPLLRGGASVPGRPRDQVPDILEKDMRALLRQADGAFGDAVTLMREATALADAMPAEYGPPGDVKPVHELFGEMLLEAGRPREAQREFAHQLRLAPKRALSLRGLARAAAAVGDHVAATRAYGDLLQIWHGADANLPALVEARRFLAARP